MTRRLSIYADRSHYVEKYRPALNDILKAHWTDASLDDRLKTYGKSRVELFEPVEDPARADIHLLTMKWPHYVDHGIVDQAVKAVELARRMKRPIAVFGETDSEANFPIEGQDIHVFECSAYRSRVRQKIHGMPAFIGDPVAEVCGGVLDLGAYRKPPVIGFCGQAGTTLPRHAGRWLRAKLRLAQWKLGRLRWEPPPLEHTWFRHRVLETFTHSPEVQARYVLRTQYRAGLSGAAGRDADTSRREFVSNIIDTDYTVCMRGGGNFSVRFYEALALGRTPIFIDTDCVLPYSDRVDWKHLVVWIDTNELARAPAIVAKHHAELTERTLYETRMAARKIWLERLTPDGFYEHFHEHFPEQAAHRREPELL